MQLQSPTIGRELNNIQNDLAQSVWSYTIHTHLNPQLGRHSIHDRARYSCACMCMYYYRYNCAVLHVQLQFYKELESFLLLVNE